MARTLPPSSMNILLDTCTLLHALENPDKLPLSTKEILLKEDCQLFASSIMAFEIGILITKKQITLQIKPEEWLKRAFSIYKIKEIPINSSIALKSTQLSHIHKDPADRILIATAIENKLKILTPDKHIHAYKEVKTIW
jgi:PIN domain nuclease of toxin-antitoxin system